MKKISYQNIRDNYMENFGNFMNGKKTVLNLFISSCFGCPEGRRVSLLKDLSQKIDLNRSQIIFLFGKGNGVGVIKEYIEQLALGGFPITIGVIEIDDFLPEKEYFKIFQFDIDPRLFIFNERGDIVFLENLEDKRKINLNFLSAKLR